MCGIIGRISIGANKATFKEFKAHTSSHSHRGPDNSDTVIEPPFAFGHTRLSIIDLDPRAHQPMTDLSGRFTIVFNGEIYNYKELRQECEQLGYSFKTQSDTEVLLVLFMHFGNECLTKLNGFFAFAVVDRKEKTCFLARDRFGIKPLVYYFNEKEFGFASELKALMELGYERKIDKVSLFTYFKFNYIPAPSTILHDHFKLEPGHQLEVRWNEKGIELSKSRWYKLPYDPADEKQLSAHDYKQAQKVLKRFLRESVRRRLVSDVPIGSFLSGGIDSSIITALAAEEKTDLESYSIGFPDQPYYDETQYARRVAKHLGIKHHVFGVRGDDLLGAAEHVLEHLDEPFADSSALNVYLLAQKTRQHVKVALSGDGGDELFGGYHKHGAEYRARHAGIQEQLVGNLKGVWHTLPASRSGRMGNLVRQLRKFSEGYQLTHRDRYWRWAGILTEEQANYFLREAMLPRDQRLSDDGHTYKKRKDTLLQHISKQGTVNEVLLSDILMVLPNDMLYKVDSMSMAHGLEVRTPMLDQHVVKHAFRLPFMFKVNHGTKKKLLQDAYRDMLPSEVFSRKKKGFEVPLLEWFHGPMKASFEALCEDADLLEAQGLFNPDAIAEMRQKLYSRNPGDIASSAWAFMVFQSWYKKYML